MRPIAFLGILLLSSSLLLSCKGEKTAEQSTSSVSVSAADLTAEQLGELGARIKKNPNGAAALLSERGLTEESFEKAIRKVTEDKDASQRYAAAFRETEQKL